MSLASMWAGKFTRLRNTLGGCHGFMLLSLRSGLASRRLLGPRRCISMLLHTKSERSFQEYGVPRPGDFHLAVGSSSRVNTTTNEHSDGNFGAVQCSDLREGEDKGRVAEYPPLLIVFDIETTGFKHGEDRIIEIALRVLKGGKNSTFKSLVNPEQIVKNSRIHGITSSMVNRADVPRFCDLIPTLGQYVKSHLSEGQVPQFIAHNGHRFDVPFLASEYKRCGMEIPADWRFLDTLHLARRLIKLDGSKLKSIKLEALGVYYNYIEKGKSHRAMSDVNKLCHVFSKLTFDLKLTMKDIESLGVPAICKCSN